MLRILPLHLPVHHISYPPNRQTTSSPDDHPYHNQQKPASAICEPSPRPGKTQRHAISCRPQHIQKGLQQQTAPGVYRSLLLCTPSRPSRFQSFFMMPGSVLQETGLHFLLHIRKMLPTSNTTAALSSSLCTHSFSSNSRHRRGLWLSWNTSPIK